MDVVQGCVMISLLFVLFLIDPNVSLNGGVNVNGKVVKVFTYADDIYVC